MRTINIKLIILMRFYYKDTYQKQNECLKKVNGWDIKKNIRNDIQKKIKRNSYVLVFSLSFLYNPKNL